MREVHGFPRIHASYEEQRPRSMKWFCLLLCVLALSVTAGCGEKGPKLPRLGASDAIVAFGDSLTFGTGAAEQESYPAVLSKIIGREVIRAGVPGEVTAQGLQRLPEVIDEYRPRLVIVCLGGNDMLRKVNAAEIKANLRQIIKTLTDRGIAVVLIGVPQPALLASPPEWYAELSKEFGIPYEGTVVKNVLYAAGMRSDLIHPNAKGYQRMAEALAELLREAGAI
jgi:acyl-CoA thioesterase I